MNYMRLFKAIGITIIAVIVCVIALALMGLLFANYPMVGFSFIATIIACCVIAVVYEALE